MTKWCVVDEDVFLGDALGLQIGFQDVVGGPWVNIVGAEKGEFFNAKLFEIVVNSRNGLLVGCSTCIEDVFSSFLRPSY